VDAVFDTVGDDTLRRSWGVLKARGRLVTIAASEEGSQDERTRSAFFIVEARRAELEEVARLIDSGEVRPVIGAEFPLADALLAYRHKPARGKVVLWVGDAG
jgi:NADPH:quinone reductase-like Zn-dependent oxidoreductase